VTIWHHSVPPALFDEIAAGGGGADAVSLLAAIQHSKHKLLLAGVLDETQAADHRQRRLAETGYELLAVVQRHDPDAANAVIRHPSVGAWATRTLRALRGGATLPGAEPAMLCGIAAAAAIRAGLPARIEVPVHNGAVILPSLGAATADGSSAVVQNPATGPADVVSGSRRVSVPPDPHHDAPGWSGLRRITTGRLDVLVDDADPFRMPAAQQLAPRLSTGRAGNWTATFGATWPLLDRHHPKVATEIAAAVKVIVPLEPGPYGPVSSSAPEAFGAVAMSQPPDPCTLAMTLTHELHHLKLSALLDAITLTEPDDGRRFYAPWRDDPRPADALLQGAYAFLGVSRFWRRQRRHEEGTAAIRAHTEYARWRAAALQATGTLRSSGSLTRRGTDFVQAMARTLRSWLAEPVPEQACALAQRQDQEHRDRWQAAHGPIQA
jgi:HEXXH motif-containing protein